jgi:uncharacterized protein (DUF486 family)
MAIESKPDYDAESASKKVPFLIGLRSLSVCSLAESKAVSADSGSPRRLAILAILRPGIARIFFCLQVPSANAGVLVTPAPQLQRKLVL